MNGLPGALNLKTTNQERFKIMDGQYLSSPLTGQIDLTKMKIEQTGQSVDSRLNCTQMHRNLTNCFIKES